MPSWHLTSNYLAVFTLFQIFPIFFFINYCLSYCYKILYACHWFHICKYKAPLAHTFFLNNNVSAPFLDCVYLSYWMIQLVFERSQCTLYLRYRSWYSSTSFFHRLQRRFLDHRAVVCHRLRPTGPVLALCDVLGRAYSRDSTNDFQQIWNQH